MRGERFVIPVKAEFRRRVPGVIHGSSSSGQTVFVEPLETIEQNNELQRLLDEEQREVHRILVAMTRAIGAEADAILAGTAVLAEVESALCAGAGLRMSWSACGRCSASQQETKTTTEILTLRVGTTLPLEGCGW